MTRSMQEEIVTMADNTAEIIHESSGLARCKPMQRPERPLANSKGFGWNPIWAGKCNLSAIGLTVFDDGHAEFDGDVFSLHDPHSDSWGCKFHFNDDHGVQIYEFGWIWSPSLTPTAIRWHSGNQLFYPSYMFQSVFSPWFEYHC